MRKEATVNGSSCLTWRCPVARCGHRTPDDSFICRPCWRLVPEPLQRTIRMAGAIGDMAGLIRAALAAVAAVSAIREAP